jgi:excisionase family DNA binding protein
MRYRSLQHESPAGGSVCGGFEPLLDDAEAADLLGIHPKTLQRWAREGRVPTHRLGRKHRYRASELDEWIRTGINWNCQSARVNQEAR